MLVWLIYRSNWVQCQIFSKSIFFARIFYSRSAAILFNFRWNSAVVSIVFFWYTRRCLNISIIWFESWSLTRTYSLVCGPRNYLVHLKLSYRKYRLDRSTVPVTVSFRLEYPNVRNKLRLKSTSSHKNRPKWLSPLNGINLIDNCQLQFTARYLLFTKCIRSAFWLSL